MCTPFIQTGGLGPFYEMFGDQYADVLDALNNSLVASHDHCETEVSTTDFLKNTGQVLKIGFCY